jgi:putative ABC transport system permease protein
MMWLTWLYSLILRLGPEDFRRRYGPEATAVAVHRVADRKGSLRLSAACRELVDLLSTIRHERREARVTRRAAGWQPRRRWNAIGADIRNALRSFRTAPGFTAVAVGVLMLGIGASTAIFSVVDAVVLRGLPFDESDRIARIGRLQRGTTVPGVESAQTFFDWREQQDVFEQMGASAGIQFTVLGEGSAAPEMLPARRITADLFALLRVAPAMGRAFTAENEILGRHYVAVISDGLWRRRFGSDPAVLGKTLITETATWEIVGVMPPGFSYPFGSARGIEVWVPFAPTPADRTRASGRNFAWTVIGRLKPGVTVVQAEARIQQITTTLARDNPEWFREGTPVSVVRLHDAIVNRVRAWMLLLLGAGALVLLIACVNVANLMLVRATVRERDLAVRAALGGTRWQLARSLLVESLLLGAIGTAGGVLLANWGVAILKASMPQGVPRLASIAIDGRVLTVAAIASLVTGVLFGMAPAIQGSRADVMQALRERGRSSTSSAGRQRFRAGLVVAEVTLAVVLLIGAGLFISSFVRFANVDLGFDTRNVLALDAYLNSRDPSWRTRGRAFVTDILGRLQTIPGVEAAAGIVDGLPLTGSWNRSPVTLPGRPPVHDPDGIVRSAITPDYFKVMRIPILRGRAFTDADSQGSEPVAIVNDVAERLYFQGEGAIGKVMTIEKVDRVVIGVVRGTRINGPETDVWQQLYLPVAQSEVGGADFVLRTSGSPEAIRHAAIAAIRAVRPQQSITETQSMEGYFNVIAAQRKFLMQLLGLFGLLGTVIADAGIYGVMAYIVAQQTQEIGIRMALGARPSQVLGRVLIRSLTYVAIGLALGLGGAWGLSRLIAGFLFQVQAQDRVVYVAVVAVLTAAAVAATLIPARRAARVDPVVALRAE